MEILIEFLGELLFEGIFELIQSDRVPKFIRYPLLGLFIIIYVAIIALLTVLAIKSINKGEVIIGIFFLLCDLLLLIMLISFFIKLRKKKTTH